MTEKKGTKMVHSVRARQNMTGQLKARLAVMNTNLESRQREVKKTQTYIKYLPNAKATLERQKKGIVTIKKQIATLKVRIRKLQKEGKINKIL